MRIESQGAGSFEALVEGDAEPQALFALVRERNGIVRELVPHRRSLEEVFLGAVRGEEAKS
jgi:hypothetical protein